MKQQICVLKAGVLLTVKDVTKSSTKNLGIYTIRGLTTTPPIETHLIILQDVPDDGHCLKLYLNSDDGVNTPQIENCSDPLKFPVEFSVAHSGLRKKRLKPGEILTAPVTYLIPWNSMVGGISVAVNLSFIPLPKKNGLKLFYTVNPA